MTATSAPDSLHWWFSLAPLWVFVLALILHVWIPEAAPGPAEVAMKFVAWALIGTGLLGLAGGLAWRRNARIGQPIFVYAGLAIVSGAGLMQGWWLVTVLVPVSAALQIVAHGTRGPA